MDSKTLSVLEYHKVLERLAAHCDFSVSKDLARAIEPTASIDLARARLAEVTEARRLFSAQDFTIGGAHDIRPLVGLCGRGGVLDPADMLSVKNTLIACRELKRGLEKQSAFAPRLCNLSLSLPEPAGIVEAISRTISERGDVLDSASPKLASIRSELRVAHGRLMSKLQKYVTESRTSGMLQEGIITQRDGRYVIPLRAEYKGQIKSIVHDQSASGATLFVEPIAVVELNNAYREAQLAERDEERRVLAELSAQVGLHAGEIVTGIEALAEIDLAFARAKYAEEIHASEPALVERLKGENAHLANDQPSNLPTIKLLKARHPLIDPASVVPIDVDLAEGVFSVVITGPNTGGKTVSLKTVGLLVLMAQSGLHIPAQSGSALSLFHAVWADIGDEQSIEQSLSTFSGHITNIIRILKKADRHALVILDELGAGTDPQEGAALARAILAHLLERGVTTFVATHFPELKTFAHGTPGVVNASLEFDIQTLRPTYKLTIGIPGRSNALAIAQRLGLPEEILAVARSEVNPDELRADHLLDDLHRQRKAAHKEREKAERARSEVHRQRRELGERLEKIEDERRVEMQKARAEGELEVALLMENIAALKRDLQKMKQPLDQIKQIEAQVETLQEKMEAPVERKAKEAGMGKSDRPAPLKLGERVYLSTLKAQGIITALGVGDAEVQIGALRVRAKLGEVERATEDGGRRTEDERRKTEGGGRKAEEKKKAKGQKSEEVSGHTSITGPHSSGASPGMELDIRGQRAEEALSELENYLDRAFLADLPFIRIIHGKGTGKLRQAVRETLKGHPHVKSFENGLEAEGGEGVTVVKIRNE
jgi:DNA mismatch repair protein MutS2